MRNNLTNQGLDKMDAIYQMTFSIDFLIWKLLYFDSNFTEISLQWFSWQQISIGSDNGMCQTGNTAFPEPLTACASNANMP